MKTAAGILPGGEPAARKPRNGGARESLPHPLAPDCHYDFLNNRFVYLIVSARARGLSVGINLNPGRDCNFDCIYCEVNRRQPAREERVDVEVMAAELERTLQYVQSGRLQEHPVLGGLPRELLQLRHVSISGLGEPTLCPNFVAAVQEVVHLRALGRAPFYKLVLVTNGSLLDAPTIHAGLKYFTPHDEIWIKLDAGTQAGMDGINRATVPLEKILHHVLTIGRQRPVVIQSLFVAVDGQEPEAEAIEQYALRLRELKLSGAQIALVQIYSATRPPVNAGCTHLPLKSLSRIAQVVRCATGLAVEVF